MSMRELTNTCLYRWNYTGGNSSCMLVLTATPEHLFIAHVLTVLSLFIDRGRLLSLLAFPVGSELSRVRTDKNSEVAMYMLRHRGCGRASVIAGRSVHNQRIVFFQGCLVFFVFSILL